MSTTPNEPSKFHGIWNDPGCYKPLDTSEHRKEIRYLEVAPGKQHDPLVCFLRYTSLGHEPTAYEALSYTWGCLNETVTMVLHYQEGSSTRCQQFKITPNLQSALRQLRNRTSFRNIWVDAVCINQMDVRERTHQVQLMGEVYSKAKGVLVWLGDPDISSEIAIRVLQTWMRLQQARITSGYYSISATEALEQMEAGFHHFSPLDDWGKELGHEAMEENLKNNEKLSETLHFACMGDAATADLLLGTVGRMGFKWAEMQYYDRYQTTFWIFLQSINDFLARAWFRRTWVIQEVFQSQRRWTGEASVSIHIGPHRISWSDLCNFMLQFYSHTLLPETFHWRDDMQSDLKDIHFFQTHWITMWRSYRHNVPQNLLELILATREFLATDARDKIFAMVLLASDTQPGSEGYELVRPDYDKQEVQILCDFTRWHIQRYKSTDVLCMASPDPFERYSIELPSWAADLFNRADSWPFMDLPERERFTTLWPLEHVDKCYSLERKGLAIPGMWFDTVSELVSPIIFGDQDFEIGVVLEGEKEFLFSYVLEHYRERWVDPADGRFDHDFVQNFLSMVGCFETPNLPHEANGFVAYLQRFGLKPDVLSFDVKVDPFDSFIKRHSPGYLTAFYDQAKKFCVKRCIFRTRTGHLAIGPSRVEEGDMLVYLESGKVPFIIRQTASCCTLTNDHNLIGPCLIFGGSMGPDEANKRREMHGNKILGEYDIT